jgi:hypothetical protein
MKPCTQNFILHFTGKPLQLKKLLSSKRKPCIIKLYPSLHRQTLAIAEAVAVKKKTLHTKLPFTSRRISTF